MDLIFPELAGHGFFHDVLICLLNLAMCNALIVAFMLAATAIANLFLKEKFPPIIKTTLESLEKNKEVSAKVLDENGNVEFKVEAYKGRTRNLAANTTILTVIFAACSLILAGVYYFFGTANGVEWRYNTMMQMHFIATLVLMLITLRVWKKADEDKDRDELCDITEKALTSMFSFLKTKTDVETSQLMMSFICKTMDRQILTVNQLNDLLGDAGEAEGTPEEIGRMLIKKFLFLFEHQESGASNWFKINDTERGYLDAMRGM